jgi:hypothetical protein
MRRAQHRTRFRQSRQQSGGSQRACASEYALATRYCSSTRREMISAQQITPNRSSEQLLCGVRARLVKEFARRAEADQITFRP